MSDTDRLIIFEFMLSPCSQLRYSFTQFTPVTSHQSPNHKRNVKENENDQFSMF
jgi:hypothetical protein